MRNSSLSRLAAGAALACLIAQPASAGGRSDLVIAALSAGKAQHAPAELLVAYKAGANENDFRQVRGRLGASLMEIVRERSGSRLELLRIPASVSMEAAVRLLEADIAVEYAEPNWIYTHQAASNDTYYTNGSLWGMYGDATSPANAFGSQAGEAWANGKENCGSVYVGVIDEGYMYAHEDIAANAGTNPGETGGGKETNGVDDDGNGLKDDVYGWDFVSNNNSVFDGVGDDHGTHIAGTIGGVGGNAKGVAGVCWTVKLINAKFLGSNGGTTANAIKSVDYMTDLKTRHGISLVATSNSWGGGGFSQGLQDAIERANTAGVLFVAAAGNSTYNCDTSSNCYPAEYPNANIISVASLDSNGVLSSYSNYGATTIDIGAPGRDVWSTVPKRRSFFSSQAISGYSSYSGTSMACPHVSGAAAMYKAQNPGASAPAVKAAILNSAVATPSLAGKTVTGGRLNVSGF
jgi:subtilisin family serine protease